MIFNTSSFEHCCLATLDDTYNKRIHSSETVLILSLILAHPKQSQGDNRGPYSQTQRTKITKTSTTQNLQKGKKKTRLQGSQGKFN